MQHKLKVVYRPLSRLRPYENNSRTHSEQQIQGIMKSMREFGFINPIAIVPGDDFDDVIAGHGRQEAAARLRIKEVPTIDVSHLSPKQRRAWVIADNKLTEQGGWNLEKLAGEISALAMEDFDINILGFNDDELDKLLRKDGGVLPSTTFNNLPSTPQVAAPKRTGKGKSGKLVEKFMVNPYSVIDARDSWWVERKAAWKCLEDEIKGSENGVFENSKPSDEKYEQENDFADRFDPVLAELLYRWFVPKSATGVLDLFHGGLTKGFVANRMRVQYIGVGYDGQEWKNLAPVAGDLDGTQPLYISLPIDARIEENMPSRMVDFLLCNPTAHTLDTISKLIGKDLPYDAIADAYRACISSAVAMLSDNRFACFIVSDFRDKESGSYFNFVSETIHAAQEAGLSLYNDAVIINPPGSMPLRAGKYFDKSRKLGKIHQNMLVFVKGNAKEATKICGKVDVEDIPELPKK